MNAIRNSVYCPSRKLGWDALCDIQSLFCFLFLPDFPLLPNLFWFDLPLHALQKSCTRTHRAFTSIIIIHLDAPFCSEYVIFIVSAPKSNSFFIMTLSCNMTVTVCTSVFSRMVVTSNSNREIIIITSRGGWWSQTATIRYELLKGYWENLIITLDGRGISIGWH